MELVKGWRTKDGEVFPIKKDAINREIFLKTAGYFAEGMDEKDVINNVNDIVDAVKTIKARGKAE